MSDLRSFLQILTDRDELIKIQKNVDTSCEIAAILKRFDNGSAVFFEEVETSKFKVVGGVCGTRERVCLAIGAKKENLHLYMNDACKNPIKPKVVEMAPVKEFVGKPDLSKIPVVKYYEKDAGPYITAGIVFAKDPKTGIQNASFHRMLVLDKDHLTIRLVPRHLFRMFNIMKNQGKPLEIAVAIGLHPGIMMGSTVSIPYGSDEMAVANALLKGELKLVKCENVDVMVPADAEMILEGLILPDEEADERMTDILGLYDVWRKQPVVELVGIMHRQDPIYQVLLPAGSEHRLLMGMPREVMIWDAVRTVVPEVFGVNLTPSSGGWLHAIVSIRKQSEGDAKNAILASFAAHPSLKTCTVVDEDINIYDLEDVEWAVMTRMQPDRDLVILKNLRGSSLDPSSDQEQLITSKVGIDATITLLKHRELFERATILGERKY